ncbi:hypothetical protein ACN42_g394 [Penicillium freii]|uniref:Uncharacterized protein n=1 Tax=Penicillium freii TaxID=48697 RepID=A0A117NSM0_PENFR|nr:hypothetical protein ACN42_g394 [Penicillium freii]
MFPFFKVKHFDSILCICLLTRGETTRIDRHIDNASLLLRGQRSRVLGEQLHWDMASVMHFIEVTLSERVHPAYVMITRCSVSKFIDYVILRGVLSFTQ